MTPPLQILLDWFNKQPRPVREHLRFTATLRFDLPEHKESEQAFEQWLVAPATISSHLGQCLSIRIVFDYELEQTADPFEWEEKLGENAQALESEVISEAGKALLRANLEEMDERRATWARCAESWRKLCTGPLSNDALRAWEHLERENRP